LIPYISKKKDEKAAVVERIARIRACLGDGKKDFHIQKYEEGVWLGDWGGPPAELVRMIARKKRVERNFLDKAKSI